MDDPDQGANTMNAKFQADFAATAERIVAEKDSISGRHPDERQEDLLRRR